MPPGHPARSACGKAEACGSARCRGIRPRLEPFQSTASLWETCMLGFTFNPQKRFAELGEREILALAKSR